MLTNYVMGWGEEKKYFDIIGVNAIYGLKLKIV